MTLAGVAWYSSPPSQENAMTRAPFSPVLMTSALTAGCAGNRDNLADAATAAAAPATTATPGTAAALATPATGAVPPNATATATPTDSSGSVTVVDGNQLAARNAATLLCRDL